MAHSFIEFREQRFALNDIDVIVFAELLRSSILHSPIIPTNIRQMLDWWEEALTFSAGGAIDLELDEFLKDAKSIELVCSALERLMKELRIGGSTLSAHRLTELTKKRVQFIGDRGIEDFEAIARRFQILLQCQA